MKAARFVPLGAAIAFCALGFSGHKEAWAAAAVCFFAAIMILVGRRRNAKD